MMRKHHPLLRAAVLLLWTAACWRLFVPALDVPTQELRANALASMQGTLLLLLLAGAVLLVCFRAAECSDAKSSVRSDRDSVCRASAFAAAYFGGGPSCRALEIYICSRPSGRIKSHFFDR